MPYQTSPHLTLEDIARLSGVSRSTVSRVINDHPNVSEPVRRRVQKVIQETGYHPHQAARSLASQQTNIIGLVIPRSIQAFFADPYFSRLIQGMAQACNKFDYTLSLFVFYTKEDELTLFPRISQPGLVDGIIIPATHADDRMFNQLSHSEINYIVAGRPINVPDASYVDIDNVRGAYTAVRHLVHLGYSRIATITGLLNTATGQDRLQGYREALMESGIDFDESLVVKGDFSQDSGYYGALRLLANNPEGVFVASDNMAFGALRAFRENGLEVPGDIALVGYDDLPLALQADPPLTTIRQPIRRLGIKLVETLLDIISVGPMPPRKVIFGTELVIRESCGANQSMRRVQGTH